MSRICAKDPDAVRQAMVRGHDIVPKYGKRTTDVLKGMLRPAIMAPKGRKLISLDWSGIEARLTPWCSYDPIAQDTLDIFRNGGDIYVSTAANMFNKPESEVTISDRLLGKVAVLACGFAGSIGAFASMGRIYGVTLPEPEAKRMVNLWRRANPWAVKFWRALEHAMLRAMQNPGYEFSAGAVTYLYDRQHLWYALPSGRVLCYPYARFDEMGDVYYAKAAWRPMANAKEWPRARLWVGVLVENLVQASANCLLRHALRVMDEEGIKLVGSVHDEIIAECSALDADDIRRRMTEIMTTPPAWATGLPLNVEGDIMDRFAK
jgi:DNA polymerase